MGKVGNKDLLARPCDVCGDLVPQGWRSGMMQERGASQQPSSQRELLRELRQ